MTFLSNLAPRLPRDIPGFYYDEEKKRYFKIEPHPTAPSDAAWAAGNVKKRKAEKAQAQQKRKRQDKLKACIKRSSLLAHPLTGGRLARELGVVDPELPVESWLAALCHKGEVSFWPGQEQNPDAPSISCLLVEGGDEADGLGMAYAAIDGRQLQASYLPTDRHERINFGITQRMRASRLSALRDEAIQADITSIAYHQASHTVIVTSNSSAGGPDSASRGRVHLFQPARPDDLGEGDWGRHFVEHYGGRKPTWLLGDTGAYVSYTSPARGLTMNAARACPPSSSAPASCSSSSSSSSPGGLDALIATSHGIMGVDRSRTAGEVYWVTPKPTALGGGGGTRPPMRDVFGVDYHPSNPRVCYAGSRDGRVHRVDSRAPPSGSSGWDWFRHRSSAAHVRCLDDHRVLVAGPRSAMAIYDTRWAVRAGMRLGGGNNSSSSSSSSKKNNLFNDKVAQPVVQFTGYRNEAHIKIGLDVTHDVGGAAGLSAGGVVAAGLDDGTVGVFSLRTGRRLRAGDVDNPLRAATLRSPAGEGGLVKALQFRRLPWEKEPSLFVGVGPVVKKFTFGVEDDDGEW
ncbi:hypothetical protein diail_8641 [Diaporthe ilicicola]|nr:hypothetical protein diail_8641 [Diaporthe ilicicola]